MAENKKSNEKRLIKPETIKLELAFIGCEPKHLAAVERCTTVDAVEVVHGRWKNSDFIRGMQTCTNCGAQRNPKFKIGGGAWNFCPNCGAKMEGWNDQ